MDESELIEAINELKREKNALILVHNYQRPEIYEIADHIGDSLELSQIAARADKDIIVVCGVRFMAETAKILCPEKKVLLARADAGCPMAQMVTPDDIQRLRKRHPYAAVACYVNTTAEVKAVSDICVTSANAVKVVESLDEDEVIFVPDRNLGSYVAGKTCKSIILFNGCCPVHDKFSAGELRDAKEKMPNSYVIVHPECPDEFAQMADSVESTGGMIRAARQTDKKDILIGTEVGMIVRLRREVPGKNFQSIGMPKICPDMKKTTLQDVYETLRDEKNEVEVSKDIRERALIAVRRMLAVR